ALSLIGRGRGGRGGLFAGSGEAPFVLARLGLPEGGYVEAQQRDPERAERLVEIGASLGERLCGGGRIRGDSRGQAVGGLGEMDAYFAELGGLQRDPRLREPLPRGQVDRGPDRVDHV